MRDDVARMIPTRNPKRMLDLAGGHGGYAIAMCRRHSNLAVTIVELEGAARIGRDIVREQDMEDRIEFLVGDMFTTDLGAGYDVATAFQILHHFDEDVNVELLTRAHEALRDGGTIAILEQERPPTGERGSNNRRADRTALLRDEPRPHLHRRRAHHLRRGGRVQPREGAALAALPRTRRRHGALVRGV